MQVDWLDAGQDPETNNLQPTTRHNVVSMSCQMCASMVFVTIPHHPMRTSPALPTCAIQIRI